MISLLFRLSVLIEIELTSSQIPKPSQTEGLGIEWSAQKTDMDKLKALFNEVKAKM